MQQSRADSAANPPQTHADVLSRYKDLRRHHQGRHEGLRSRQQRMLLVLAAVAVIIAVQTSAAVHSNRPAWPMLLSFAAVAILVVMLVRIQTPIERARRLLVFYDRSILRADGTEPYTGRTGESTLSSAAEPHLYQRDLDILGPQSLFSRLATVRTGIGERGLARYLLEPATHEESVLRQQAVRELLPLTELRERIALLGQSSFQQISASFFDQWLDEEPPRFHSAIRYLLAVTATMTIALLLAGFVRLRPWTEVFQNTVTVLAVQAAISVLIRKRVQPLLQGGARLQSQVRLFAEGLALLETLQFTSPKLLTIQKLAREPSGAVKLLRRLDGWLLVVEQRTKEYFFIFSLLTASGVQAAIAIAAWKRKHAPAMRLWLEAWAEFEALNALATYAFEHPADDAHSAWPELLPVTTPPLFEAKSLAHPLLPNAVANDIALGRTDNGQRKTENFLLISGSNMAGKSTLMRSIGVNAILAYAGAPVRAASLRLTPLTIGASIALIDSLAEGKSKFLAEVERLAAIVRTSESGFLLFLVDEIFSGTNSLDRHTAAAAVLRRLLAHDAIGALSTHDLALTSLATKENGGLNVHMASPNPEDPLAFDYLLKPGINQHSNALAIIRLIGLDVDR
jgi:stress-induced morphogen